MVSVKICGLKDEKSVRAVIAAKADYAGFVYYPKSPRHVDVKAAAMLRALLPATIKAVSVLVDPADALLADLENVMEPDYFQLHGNESPEHVRAIKDAFPNVKIIKAIKIRNSDDVAQSLRYGTCADILMFDAKPPELTGILPGGNGLVFDWTLLKNRNFPLPWILSGGLTDKNVREAIRQTGAQTVDVSSGVERSPGVKDVGLIEQFVKAARHA